MTDALSNQGLSRRSVAKGAAWSVPVLAAAVSVPMASASTGNIAGVEWTGRTSQLINLRLLNGQNTIGISVGVTRPTQFTITNGPGAITNETANVQVVVGRPTGININVGHTYGFGVATLNGVDVAAQNKVEYKTVLGARVGFPLTTFTGTTPVTIDSEGQLQVPIVFGLSGSRAGVSVSALARFPVTLTVEFADGSRHSASTDIVMPANAGIL
jgi:hypothetical protein